MLKHMRTSIDMPESLLERARKVAESRKITLRDLFEEALRAMLEKYQQQRSFKLRDGSFKGDGLRPGVDLENWNAVRELIYEGRGG